MEQLAHFLYLVMWCEMTCLSQPLWVSLAEPHGC